MNGLDVEQRKQNLAELIAEHSRLTRQAGRRWYSERYVRAAYARVTAARHRLHPLTLASDAGAANELDYFGGEA